MGIRNGRMSCIANKVKIILAFNYYYSILYYHGLPEPPSNFDLFEKLKKKVLDVNVCFLTASGRRPGDLKKEDYRTLGKGLSPRAGKKANAICYAI